MSVPGIQADAGVDTHGARLMVLPERGAPVEQVESATGLLMTDGVTAVYQDRLVRDQIKANHAALQTKLLCPLASMQELLSLSAKLSPDIQTLIVQYGDDQEINELYLEHLLNQPNPTFVTEALIGKLVAIPRREYTVRLASLALQYILKHAINHDTLSRKLINTIRDKLLLKFVDMEKLEKNEWFSLLPVLLEASLMPNKFGWAKKHYHYFAEVAKSIMEELFTYSLVYKQSELLNECSISEISQLLRIYRASGVRTYFRLAKIDLEGELVKRQNLSGFAKIQDRAYRFFCDAYDHITTRHVNDETAQAFPNGNNPYFNMRHDRGFQSYCSDMHW